MRFFLLLAAALPLAAQCGYVFQTNSSYATTGNGYVTAYSNIPSGGYSDSITVTATDYYRSSGCSWSFSADTPWITFNGQTSGGISAGQTTFSISWNASANVGGAARGGHIVFSATQLGLGIGITQTALPCTLAVGATSATALAGGASGTIPVQTVCSWNAFSNQSWITLPPNSSGTGNGTVNYTVAANGCVGGRTGSLGVSVASLPNATFTVTQDGSQNNLTLSPTTLTLPASGGIGRITVNTGDGCGWSAYSDSTWLTITGVGLSSGTGPIGYNVPANNGGTRTGAIHVGTQSFTVTQQSGVSTPTPLVASVQNAASYTQGAVSPGEIISIYGSNLGPTTGVSLQLTPDGKSITTTLAGTQVTFDGAPAALTYVSTSQINAVVPYGVAGRSSTQLQITYQGFNSAPQSLPVQAVTPAIFTLDRNGIGQGAVLNQNYSVNGSGNRASPGSVVQIFCTGGGVTTPASPDASVTTGINSLAVQPVTVTIGGLPAQVVYAGGAPGAVAGLTQINAVVPNGVASDSTVPIALQIAGIPAQGNVTISIQ